MASAIEKNNSSFKSHYPLIKPTAKLVYLLIEYPTLSHTNPAPTFSITSTWPRSTDFHDNFCLYPLDFHHLFSDLLSSIFGMFNSEVLSLHSTLVCSHLNGSLEFAFSWKHHISKISNSEKVWDLELCNSRTTCYHFALAIIGK